jgi:hypothetical protein
MCEALADISVDMMVVVRQVVDSQCEEVRRKSVGYPVYIDPGVSLVLSVSSQSISQTMEVSTLKQRIHSGSTTSKGVTRSGSSRRVLCLHQLLSLAPQDKRDLMTKVHPFEEYPCAISDFSLYYSHYH